MVPIHDNRHGILAMLAAMALFIANDTFLKLAASTLPPSQIMVVRSVFASAFALGLIAAMGHLGALRALRSPVVLGRAVLEGVISFLFIMSLAHLPLANATAIMQATPIILTLLAVLLGLEPVGWRRWTAIVVGFAGVLLIVRPSPSAFDAYALVALGCAVLVAVRDLVTRRIQAGIPSIVVAFASTSVVGLVGLLMSPLEDWQPLAPPELIYLVAAALLVCLANLAIIVAFRAGELSVVGPFRYTIILLSIALGFAVFGEWPDAAAWAGIGLIVGSGVYTIHREHVRRREQALEPAAAGQAAA